MHCSNRKSLAASLAVSTAAAVGFCITVTAAKNPNVIFVMSDDQGCPNLGCVGHPLLKTSNIDNFYQRSVRLTNYHVDPTCAPTRSAVMTGRYSHRTGVWHTILGRSILRRREVTMAEVFSNSGYKTAIFGKWHLGDNYPYRPQDRGFDKTVILGGGGIMQIPDFWGNDYFDDVYSTGTNRFLFILCPMRLIHRFMLLRNIQNTILARNTTELPLIAQRQIIMG